jgi:hypothetical protein
MDCSPEGVFAMRNRSLLAALIPCGAVTLALLAAVAAPSARQAGASRGPRTADGKPNLNGLWQVLNTANWDIQDHGPQPGPSQYGALFSTPPGLGVVVGNEIPYLPAAAQKKKENFANRFTTDPEAKCYMPGIPRATYMPLPFQIVQGANQIMMIYQFANATRTIEMRTPRESPIETWMGQSNGRWDGDTLVVDVTGFNDQTWFDRAGNFHSEALHVVERFTPNGPDVLAYEVTIEDPKVFSRPWKMAMTIHRRLEKNAKLLEYNCVEHSEELLYGHLRKKGE